MRSAEPLEVPMGRTLLALWKWQRRDTGQRLTVESAAAADFVLRFPAILDALHDRSQKVPSVHVAAADYERTAPENDHLEAQLVAWPSRHRLVTGALVGRGLADLAPALGSQRLEISPRGVQTALELRTKIGWDLVMKRAEALGKLQLGPTTLVERCREEVFKRR